MGRKKGRGVGLVSKLPDTFLGISVLQLLVSLLAHIYIDANISAIN